MSDITDLCEQSPAYVRAIAPYQPGKPITEVARELGLDERSIVKLASNENPRGISPKALAAAAAALPELGRYPDGFELTRALSRRLGVDMQQIVLGNGSNDVLELAGMAFLAPGRSAVYSQHAFAVYPLATQARGAQGIAVPAKDYGHDLEAMFAAIRPDTRVVFIANPNNPTGTMVGAAELESFLVRVPKNVVVVIDEAYNEYLEPALRCPSIAWIGRFPNLIVTRTFSKVYGLAGLRIGYGICRAELADLLNRVRQPFNVNNLAIAAAVAALDDLDFVRESYALNAAGMAQLCEGCKRLGLAWIPSYGNFLTVEIPRDGSASRAAAVFQKLLRLGVIVRPLAGYAMPDHLRVTIGLAAENARFLETLGAVLKD
jgi:histidinol-phosphate aminotransferase